MAASCPPAPAPLLEARAVGMAYGDKMVLNGVDLSLAANEFLAVLALGGAGKTLLFRTLAGLQQPTSGAIYWFGNDISRLSERQRQTLRRSIGAVHQQGALFADLTVEENIRLPLVELSDHDPRHIEGTVRFTLEVSGLLAHRNDYPNTLSTVAMRRAALARALVLGPKMLICDDVFAGLDPRAQHQINDYLRAMHVLKSMATVILTHNVTMAFDLADRVAILAGGRIVTSGSPAEIRASTLPDVVNLLQRDVAAD